MTLPPSLHPHSNGAAAPSHRPPQPEIPPFLPRGNPGPAQGHIPPSSLPSTSVLYWVLLKSQGGSSSNSSLVTAGDPLSFPLFAPPPMASPRVTSEAEPGPKIREEGKEGGRPAGKPLSLSSEYSTPSSCSGSVPHRSPTTPPYPNPYQRCQPARRRLGWAPSEMPGLREEAPKGRRG